MIYKYSSPWRFILMSLCGLIASLQSIVLAYMVQTITNIGTQKKFGDLPRFLLFTITALIITFLASLIFNRLKTRAVQEANTKLRTDVLKGMLNQSVAENAKSLGFLTNDFKLLETNRFDAAIEILQQSYLIVLALGYALILNWLVTLLFLIGSCLPMIVSHFFQGPIQKASERWTESNGKYVNQTKNFLAGCETLKLYGRQASAVEKNKKTIEKLERALRQMNLLQLDTNSWLNLIADLFTFLGPFLVGIYLVIKGQTTLGVLFAIVQLSNSFVNPILTILDDRNKLATTKKIVTKTEQFVAAGKKKEKPVLKDFSDLQVENLTLTRQGKILARKINLSIKKGSKVAIIGPSGSGKSTLLQFLMTGKYGKAGQIFLNKLVVEPGSFASVFAYASQAPVIFANSLWFNLTLGADISREIVTKVCEQLGLGSLIKEKGFTYSLGDNADRLSGGQLARVELARAILAQRPVLLLDEINASLDKETSAQIHEYLLNSDLTFIEVIHHYEKDELACYDEVVDLAKYAG